MKRFLLTVVAVLSMTSIALADCPGGCPVLPPTNVGGATQNTSNSIGGTSAPVGILQNSQYNFNNQGQVGYGGGITCQDNSVNPYVGVANSGGAGLGNYNTVQYGVAATILVGPNHRNCLREANIIIQQHANDTVWGNMNQCVNLHNARVDLSSPSLHGLCDGLQFAPLPVVVIPPPVVSAPAPVIQTTVVQKPIYRMSNFSPTCTADQTRSQDLTLIHKLRRHKPVTGDAYDQAMGRLVKAVGCNVKTNEINLGLN